MIDFDEVMKRVNRSKKIEKDILYSEEASQTFLKLVRKYVKENPENNNYIAISNYVEKIMNSAMKVLMCSPSFKSDTIKINTLKGFFEKLNEVDAIFYDILREEEESHRRIDVKEVSYSTNKDVAKRQLIEQMLYENRIINNQDLASRLDYFSKTDAYQEMPLEEKEKLMELSYGSDSKMFQDELSPKEELEQIKDRIKNEYPIFREDLRKRMINFLGEMGNYLNQIGCLEKFAERQEKVNSRLSISSLTFPFNKDSQNEEKDKKDKSEIDVLDIFSKEKLEQLDINQIYALNAFWLNRFAKIVEDMNATYFVVQSLDLWKEVLEAKEDPKTSNIKLDVNPDELESLYKKVTFLKIISNQLAEEIRNGSLEDSPLKNKRVENGCQYDVWPIIKKISEQIGDRYSKEFEKMLPGIKHDFIDDYLLFFNLDLSKNNAYYRKDGAIIGFLNNIEHDSFPLNYGVMPEKGKDFTRGKKILLGADVHGLNMPVRLHVDRSLIKDYTHTTTGTNLFPLYEGANDFTVNYSNIGTQILGPVSIYYRQKLKEILSGPKKMLSDKRNFLEHLLFIADKKKYPEHLKVDRVVTEKKGSRIVHSRPLPKFIDLDTGDIYIRSKKDGELVKETDLKDKEEEEK